MTQPDSPAPDAPTLDVSVILPVYNEAGHLAPRSIASRPR